MNIEVEGKLRSILPVKAIGRNGYQIRTIVVEAVNGHESEMIAVDLHGDDVNKISEGSIGGEVKINANLSSRKWEDKWFTGLRVASMEFLSPKEENTDPGAWLEADGDIPF
jgi:hypothetical protein